MFWPNQVTRKAASAQKEFLNFMQITRYKLLASLLCVIFEVFQFLLPILSKKFYFLLNIFAGKTQPKVVYKIYF